MGKKTTLIFMLLFGVLHMTHCFAASPNTDKSSLLALKAHLTNPNNILAKNWSQETSFCTWIGVACSARHPRVTGLDLSNTGLQGSIPTEIGNLSFLTFLDMSSNNISGLLPKSLGWLRRLKGLNISYNYLSGEIPTSLSACAHLNVLDLSYNNLTGSIPVGFGNLSQLQHLIMNKNMLTGEIPSTIFNISSLQSLYVGVNHMSGNIPKEICGESATKLEDLVLESNQFEGEIPSTLSRCHTLEVLSLEGNKFRGNLQNVLWNLSSIQVIFLAQNGFTGTIPHSIGNFSNLKRFDVGENSLVGSVPSEIGQLSALTFLRLQENMPSGEVPQSIFNLSRLRTLSLTYNNLSGNLPVDMDKRLPNIELLTFSVNQFHGKIPSSISNLSKLTVLDLSYNLFGGRIPTSLGNLRRIQVLNLGENQLANNMSKPEQDFLSSLATCEYLYTISVSSNPITGILPRSLGLGNLSTSLQTLIARSCRIMSPIPDEIGNLSSLIWLGLGYNDLTGVIPATLGNLGNLQKLQLNGNKFQGSISHVVCTLEVLAFLDLAENDLSGQLPECLGNLSSLRGSYLFDNAFSSNIPSALWFNEAVERKNLSNNFLDGSLSRGIGNMKSLIELNLSGNQLTEEIPNTRSQLPNLISLSLSNNKFSGPISESLANLVELEYLDLSHNNLSGAIPKSLEKLAYLNYFNVSFNQLSGEIPDGGPFANFTSEFFKGNKGLCGGHRLKVEQCKSSLHTPSRKHTLLKIILPATALVFVALILIFLLLRRRSKRLPLISQSDSPLPLMNKRISYLEILRATRNLDEDNLVGKGSFGSVYKGSFSNGQVFAIKVFNLDGQGALNSFDTECQILRSIRHKNLVKVITSCSNLDFKALVMAYMSNGNLEKWLYSINSTLSITQRLEIMVDVASATEYLHEGYTLPIVHCDLKPNNILLDEDMVAHVSDFGISKLLTQEQRMQHTRTLGTIGYIAPEYGSEGLVSTMVDVYSYGILLMEIFSRRKPTDEMFSGELTMRSWISESFPNSVLQIVDGQLLNTTDQSSRAIHESCIKSAIESGVHNISARGEA